MKREELLERAPVSVSNVSTFVWAKVQRTANLRSETCKELPVTKPHAMQDAGCNSISEDAQCHGWVPYAGILCIAVFYPGLQLRRVGFVLKCATMHGIQLTLQVHSPPEKNLWHGWRGCRVG